MFPLRPDVSGMLTLTHSLIHSQTCKQLWTCRTPSVLHPSLTPVHRTHSQKGCVEWKHLLFLYSNLTFVSRFVVTFKTSNSHLAIPSYLRSHLSFEVKHIFNVVGAFLPAAADLLTPHRWLFGPNGAVDSCNRRQSSDFTWVHPRQWIWRWNESVLFQVCSIPAVFSYHVQLDNF